MGPLRSLRHRALVASAGLLALRSSPLLSASRWDAAICAEHKSVIKSSALPHIYIYAVELKICPRFAVLLS